MSSAETLEDAIVATGDGAGDHDGSADHHRDLVFVLASQSPTRLALCQRIGLKPVVRVSDFEENLPKDLPVREFVEQTAKGKLDVVEREMIANKEHFDVIIAADTVIYYNGEIIGKPADAQDAIETLKRLRNKTHFAYSGVALAYKDGSHDLFSVETKVHMGDYSDELIQDYVDSKEPLNKAGSYGIQTRGAVLVRSVEGCHSNIVGIPIYEVAQRLSRKGLRFLRP